MKVLSLFSGVGGFDLGLEAAGMETVFQCEWDKHATSILERHWPDVPRWGDITTLTGKHILAHAPVIDVVAWGSPCQDLSVAGKRAGLEGSRSGLFHEGVRIIKELRKETNNEYPRISIWENVYGALNSNRGADFGVILNEMAEAGSLVQEWRVLDAQYFGVPQRRRRVFLISVFDSATAARCPDPLLPVSEGVQWHPSTSHQARQTVAGEVAGCLRSGGAGGVPSSRGEHLVVEPFTPSQFAQYTEGVGTLRSNGGDLAGGSETLAVIGFSHTQGLSAQPSEAAWPTLRTEGNGMAVAIPIQDGRDMDHQQNGLGIGAEGAPSYTILATGGQSVAYGLQGNMIGRQDHNGPQGAGISHPDDPMFSLTSTDRHAVATTMAVRRLTPLECERLMGWPDGWTATKADGTPQSDTHRYKQCGNGIASPVAQWIAQQLLKLDKEPHAPPATTTT
jgi:DNA (cytosine-5)-methyltransferase 1